MKANKNLTTEEQKLLDFVFSQNIILKDVAYKQIHYSRIFRDKTPYYLILKFDVDKTKSAPFDTNPGHITSFNVIHDDGSAPSCFDFHFEDNYVSILEIFNADSSFMEYKKMCIGKIEPFKWPHQK